MNRLAVVAKSVLAVGLATVIGGCASSTSSPAGASPLVVVPSIALPSIAIPSIAIPSFALPSGLGSFVLPSFSLPSGDKDLENCLPNTINGVTLTKLSFKGADFLDSGSSSSQNLRDALAGLGKTPADLSIAVAADPTGGLDVTVGAFKINGADANAIIAAFTAASQKDTPNTQITQANVGGKNVTVVTDPDSSEGPSYFYGNGDTVFFAQSGDATLAGTAIAALP